MVRICAPLLRQFLAAALVLSCVIAHAGSVTHQVGSDFGLAHELSSIIHAQLDAIGPSQDKNNHPNHGGSLCLDAHCCSLAVLTGDQDSLRHAAEGDAVDVAAASDYALSVLYGLLKPPRAIG